MRTRLTEILDLTLPILQAPMGGGVAGPGLAVAVCRAGGLGMLPIWSMDPASAADGLSAIKRQTSAPYAVNLNVAFDPSTMLELALEHSVSVMHFFWGDAAPYVARAKSGGAVLMATVASAEEALRAKDAGIDVIVAQGIEAGGHVWGQTGLTALVPAVVDASGDCPVVAAGGIGDGRALAAALMLGASGAMIGTALVVADESDAHPDYKQALTKASGADTILGTVFDIGWPSAPSRVLTNETVRRFLAARSPAERPGEGEIIARTETGSPIPRYSAMPPTRGVSGKVEEMALYAGQGVGLVRAVEPASKILGRIVTEAERLLPAPLRSTNVA